MKINFLYTLGLATLVLGTTFVAAGNADAYRGDPTQKGPNYTQERHEAMEKAFENNDYNAWKKLMNGRGRVTQMINAQNFYQFAKAHELAEQGKISEANKIREELGLGQNMGYKNGMGRYQYSR